MFKIAEAKEILAGNPTPEQLNILKEDSRAGIQKLVEAYYKRLEKQAEEKLRFEKMLEFEKEYYTNPAVKYIAGVDEAGRGPLAGPLVIAAVVLPREVFIEGLNDSKKLSEKKRESLYNEVLEKALAITVNVVSIHNIDTQNIYQATKHGMEEVLNGLALKPQVALVDAMSPGVEDMEIMPIIKGDAKSASIAAASIIAKVTRDEMMKLLDEKFPQYGFASNKGYGSKDHMEALKTIGATEYHRRSYEPIKSMKIAPARVKENHLFVPKGEDGKIQIW